MRESELIERLGKGCAALKEGPVAVEMFGGLLDFCISQIECELLI